MNVFDLMATLGLNTKEYDDGLEKSKTAGSKFGDALASAAKVGIAAVGAATTATVAFAKSAVDAGMDFDSSMSQVAATMGKTMDEMQNEVGTVDLAWGTFSGNLREYAQEMGKNTAFSATEAADALNYMALAGYDTQTSMEMLPNVLNLAAAGSMDLATASDMVTDTQTAFGISLERTSQMVDEMAKAASTGNTSVEQLGDAFLTVGGLAQELNGGLVNMGDGTWEAVDGVQELEIALTAMANAGIKGSEAGTHMRNMLLKLSSPTDDGVAKLEALGVTVFDTEGNMRSLQGIFEDLSVSMGELTQEEKLKAISDIFNTRDTASAEALLNAVSQDWDEIGRSILDAQGAAQQMADTQLDNLSGDVTLFKSALEGAQIAISDVLTPTLREFVQFGTDGLSDLTNAFQEGGLSGAMEAFGTILSDGLNMVIEMLPEMVSAGMDLLGALGQGLLDNLPVIIDAAVEIITELLNGIVQALPMLVEGGLEIIVGLANGIAEMLPELIPTIVDVVLEIVEVLIDNVDLLVDAAVALIIGLAEGLINALPELIEKVPEIVIKLTEALIDNADTISKAALELIVVLGTGLVKNIPTLVKNIPKIVKAVVSTLTVGFKVVGTIGKNIVEGIWNGIKGAKDWILGKLKEWAGSVLNGLKKFFGIASPSKVFRDQVGKFLAQGVVVGFEQEDPIASIKGSLNDGLKGLDTELNSSISVTGKESSSDNVSKYNNIPITINVYGAQGQSEERLADIIEQRINNKMIRAGMVYA